MALNSEKIRQDFTVLSKKIHGKPIIYMDSACMSLKPKCVVEKINEYYNEYPACAGRSSHKLGDEATHELHESRKKISKFIAAKNEKEIIFTRNTTESVNLISQSFGFKKKDEVLTSDKEHNSILLPFQTLGKGKINDKEVVHDVFEFSNIDDFESKLSKNTKLVATAMTSNADGTSQDVKEIIKIAHDNKTSDGGHTLVLLDGAQSIPHTDINIRKLDADFLAFSGHKMCGPTGTGVLYGKIEHLEKLKPYMIGGDTVHNTTYDSYEIEDIPERFEAGLSDYAGLIGLGEASSYLSKIGLSNISSHEKKLNEYVTDAFFDMGEDVIEIIGPKDASLRSGIISFNIKSMDNHMVSGILNHSANIMVRSGMHCVHSWFNAHKLKGSARASLYLYNTKEECDKLIDSVKDIVKLSK